MGGESSICAAERNRGGVHRVLSAGRQTGREARKEGLEYM